MQVLQKVCLSALGKMVLLLEIVLNYLDDFFTKAKILLKIIKEKLFTVHEKKFYSFSACGTDWAMDDAQSKWASFSNLLQFCCTVFFLTIPSSEMHAEICQVKF